MSSNKAQELGCSQDDHKCLCSKPDFVYGFRDCAAQACTQDDGKQLVDEAVKLCSSEFDDRILIAPFRLTITSRRRRCHCHWRKRFQRQCFCRFLRSSKRLEAQPLTINQSTGTNASSRSGQVRSTERVV